MSHQPGLKCFFKLRDIFVVGTAATLSTYFWETIQYNTSIQHTQIHHTNMPCSEPGASTGCRRTQVPGGDPHSLPITASLERLLSSTWGKKRKPQGFPYFISVSNTGSCLLMDSKTMSREGNLREWLYLHHQEEGCWPCSSQSGIEKHQLVVTEQSPGNIIISIGHAHQ